MWTWFHQPVVAILSAAHLWCKSPAPPHRRLIVIRQTEALVTVEAVWVQSNHCYDEEKSCSIVRGDHQKVHGGLEGMGVIINKNSGTQCFYTAWRPRRGLYVICTSTSLNHQLDLMLPLCLHQFVTLLSTCPSRRHDSSRQATVSSLPFQFWWAYANCSLGFLLSADGRGTRSGLMLIWITRLEILTCCACKAFVHGGSLNTSVVFEPFRLLCHPKPAQPLFSSLWQFLGHSDQPIFPIPTLALITPMQLNAA